MPDQRYDPEHGCGMEIDPAGSWVKYTDHDRIVSSLRERLGEVRELADAFERWGADSEAKSDHEGDLADEVYKAYQLACDLIRHRLDPEHSPEVASLSEKTMASEWPQEVWLNRFDDLPLEWWANPDTTSDPEDIAGKPLTARRYVPASSDSPSLQEARARGQ